MLEEYPHRPKCSSVQVVHQSFHSDQRGAIYLCKWDGTNVGKLIEDIASLVLCSHCLEDHSTLLSQC